MQHVWGLSEVMRPASFRTQRELVKCYFWAVLQLLMSSCTGLWAPRRKETWTLSASRRKALHVSNPDPHQVVGDPAVAPPDSPLGRCVKCIKTHDAATWLIWDIISTSASFHTCFITDRTVRLQEVRVGLFHSTKDIYLPCTFKTAFCWIYTVTTTRFFSPLPLPCSLIRYY